MTLQYRHDLQDDNYEAGGVGSYTVDPNSGSGTSPGAVVGCGEPLPASHLLFG